jgi:hypothetical protein
MAKWNFGPVESVTNHEEAQMIVMSSSARSARRHLFALVGAGLVVAVTCLQPVFAERPEQSRTDTESAPEPDALLTDGFWASPLSLGDTLTGTSPTQTGRNNRNGVASNCDMPPKVYPGLTDASVRYVNTYNFTNDTINRQCVVVTLARLDGMLGGLFAQTYLDIFDPANLATNYLADLGLSPVGRAPKSYSFNVEPGQNYVIVVNQVPTGAIATPVPYSITVRDRTNGGGNVVLLSNPIRIYDTRPASGAPLGAGTGPLTAGSTTSIQVTGTALGGISVPAGARAVIGNVSVTSPSGAGNLRLFPTGVATPTVATISYAAGETISNGVTVGLNAAGQMNFFVGGGATTHVIFDVTGFVMSPIG